MKRATKRKIGWLLMIVPFVICIGYHMTPIASLHEALWRLAWVHFHFAVVTGVAIQGALLVGYNLEGGI